MLKSSALSAIVLACVGEEAASKDLKSEETSGEMEGGLKKH